MKIGIALALLALLGFGYWFLFLNTVRVESPSWKIVPRPVTADPQLNVLADLMSKDRERVSRATATVDYSLHKFARARRTFTTAEIDWLVATLKHGDAWMRKAAAGLLGSGGPDAAPVAPALVPLMSDADSEVRAEAARALLRLAPGDPAVAGAMKKASLDPGWGRRSELAQFVVRYAPDTVPYVEVLNNLREDCQFYIEQALKERVSASPAASPAP